MNQIILESIKFQLKKAGTNTVSFKNYIGFSDKDIQEIFKLNILKISKLIEMSRFFKIDFFKKCSDCLKNRYSLDNQTLDFLIRKEDNNEISLYEISNILCISPMFISHKYNEISNKFEKKIHIGHIIQFFATKSGYSLKELSEMRNISTKELLKEFEMKDLELFSVTKWSQILRINLFDILSLHLKSLLHTNFQFKSKQKLNNKLKIQRKANLKKSLVA